MMSLVLFVVGAILAATEGCGQGKQMLSKYLLLVNFSENSVMKEH